MTFEPIIDKSKCKGCGMCVDICPVDVYEMKDGRAVSTNIADCLGCESCAKVCESGAITVDEQVVILHNFASNILDNIKDLESEFSKTVDENFWELI